MGSLAAPGHDRKLGLSRQVPQPFQAQKLEFTQTVRRQIQAPKSGSPFGTGSPEKARSIVSSVFTPTRGFRHAKRAYTPSNAKGRPSFSSHHLR